MTIASTTAPTGGVVRDAHAMRAWLLAAGSQVHRLDYGGRVAALGADGIATADRLAAAFPLSTVEVVITGSADGPSYDVVCLLDWSAAVGDPGQLACLARAMVAPDGVVVAVDPAQPAAVPGLGLRREEPTMRQALLDAGLVDVGVATVVEGAEVLTARPPSAAWPHPRST